MSPTVPFDVLVNFAIGQLIAFAAAPDIEHRKLEPGGPYLKYALFFGALCFAPFGFALFYLRGVTPESVPTGDIYRGVVPYIILQLTLLALVVLCPDLATWLPEVLY